MLEIFMAKLLCPRRQVDEHLDYDIVKLFLEYGAGKSWTKVFVLFYFLQKES